MEAKELRSDVNTTERLYYEDSHMREFTAKVVACEESGRGYRIALDRTAFFPEGGGQFGDIGWLSGTEVFDTKEKNGWIWHETREPIPEGTAVSGKLDFAERFSRMQQHSAEHIVSGIIHRLYGCDNVGFHLGTDVTTLDFNRELTEEQAEEVELLANRAVFANLPVEILYPSKEELEDLDYRSKIEIEGQVRLVSIPGVDLCACCAPHVKRTGEIGLIKLLACDRHRGGCRINMVSGMRAVLDYRQKQRSVTEVSVALSASPEKIGEAALHQKERQAKLREQLNGMQTAYLRQRLNEIGPQDHNVCIFEEGLDNIAARNFVNEAMERCSGVCAAFIGTEETGYHYILGSRNVDMRVFAKELNARFNGKGGGKPEMVQGSLKGPREEIARMIPGSEGGLARTP